MIQNRWSDAEAERWLAHAGTNEAERALALRVYTSRLIGEDPDLVMHGGGNTSVKVRRPDLFGTVQDVIHVKGSGWDLETIEAAGLPGLWLEPLRALRRLEALSDADMVNVQRRNLLDSTSPNPSVETLLHAFLPQRFVDHTHATPFLVLANLPNAAAVAREIFGARLGIVPYIMPGFRLAKAAAEVLEADPGVEGLLLLQHGHFAFGATARESYDRIVRHTNEAAAWLGMEEPTRLRRRAAVEGSVLPVLRGVLADATGDRDAPMPTLDLRNGADVLAALARDDIADLAARGVASPDHVIRTKGYPLVLTEEDCAHGRAGLSRAVKAYRQRYTEYFNRHAAQSVEPKTMLPPLPALAWIERLGLVGIGAGPEAAAVAADIGEQNLRVRAVGEDSGGFRPVGESDLFAMEYWSLEQAKLGKGAVPPLRGRVVLITGGAGAIGLATARAFAARGAAVMLVDRDAGALEAACASLDGIHHALECDVTAEGAADAAMEAAVLRYGGLDVLVSNAGGATPGAMVDLDENALREAFELNFFAHHRFAAAAARIFRTQGRAGQILFNISKQAVNPGRNFGAYGLPKATVFFLMRQLAMELGPDGIRVNGVNADRIRSGLVTDDFIAQRAEARGVDSHSYMTGNLLGREVEARHVAEAFVALALAERTTGHAMTVDGGNIAAALR